MLTEEQMLLLVDRLLAQTKAHELDWKEAPKQHNTYFLALGEGVVSLVANKQFFQLGIYTQSGSPITNFRFRGEHLDVGSDRMKELYFAARADALGATEIFESMLAALSPAVDQTNDNVVARIGSRVWPDLQAHDPGAEFEDDERFALADVPDPRGDE